MRNTSQLQALVASGQTIDDATLASTYYPTSSQVQSVESYLTQNGFTSVQAEPNNLLVSGQATVANVEKAFNTTLHSFNQNGATVFANTTPALVPSSLSGTAIAVLGLSNAPAAAVGPKKVGPNTPCDLTTPGTNTCVRFTYNPQTYWQTYDVGSVPQAKNVSIAVMAEGNVSGVISDLRAEENANGLPQVPYSTVQVGLASPDTSGLDEWDLDTQSSSGIAGTLRHLYVYATTSLTDSDISLEYSRWESDNLAQIGNSSFGGCEAFPYLDGSMLVDDEILLAGAAHGQTMFASSGDTGSFCSVGTPNGVNAGAPLVEYPAASPYVVAAGGTTLLSNADGSYAGEVGWMNGGGGLSQFEYSPYWEQGVQPQESGSSPESIRGVPDIAMDADPNTGFNTYVGGTPEGVGGTSLASPLSAGTYARLLSAKPSLGFAAPRLYKLYSGFSATTETTGGTPPTGSVNGFHDILVGNNTAYTALPGYDYITGMGSIDIAKMNATIGH
jgi:subtilase family serine protease